MFINAQPHRLFSYPSLVHGQAPMTRTMFRSTPSFIWATLFLPRLVLAVTPCYAPNGSEMDSRFIPCIAVEGVHSMCCRLNDTDPDICDPTGLCYWPRTKMYYRDFCTERSFDSPNCLSRTMCDAEVRLLLSGFFFFLGSTSNADFISCRQEGRPTTLAQSPCAKANQGIRSAAVRAMNAVQTKMSSRSNPRWSLSVLLPPVKPPPRRPRRGIQGRRRTLRSAWVLESHWGSLR